MAAARHQFSNFDMSTRKLMQHTEQLSSNTKLGNLPGESKIVLMCDIR